MSVITGALVTLVLTAFGLYYTIPNNSPLKFASNVNQSSELLDPNGPPVQFVLFTRNNSPHRLLPDNFSNSSFNSSNPTKIITHGFMSNIDNDVFQLLKNVYLDVADHNVIGMDWSALSHIQYSAAMRGANVAGQHLGDFIYDLSLNGVNVTNLHLIGHSLGAHVMGMGADNFKGGRVGRITGLDPAAPGYGDVDEEFRLDKDDAILVDVIHTFMRVIGTSRPCGDIDFYPNGGRHQPGCPEITQLTSSIFCNHGRSYELFAESIRNPKAFKSKKCKSFKEALDENCQEESEVYMGFDESYKPGMYYFKTKSSSPYTLS